MLYLVEHHAQRNPSTLAEPQRARAVETPLL